MSRLVGLNEYILSTQNHLRFSHRSYSVSYNSNVIRGSRYTEHFWWRAERSWPIRAQRLKAITYYNIGKNITLINTKVTKMAWSKPKLWSFFFFFDLFDNDIKNPEHMLLEALL